MNQSEIEKIIKGLVKDIHNHIGDVLGPLRGIHGSRKNDIALSVLINASAHILFLSVVDTKSMMVDRLELAQKHDEFVKFLDSTLKHICYEERERISGYMMQ
jgi:hypothetical protein